MMIRHLVSRLSDPATRRAFGRLWLGICVGAAGCQLILNQLLFGDPYVFLVLVVWFAGVFAPVRIAVELLHVFGPRMREQVRRETQRRADRYLARGRLAIMVDMLFEREVGMPPLAPPDLSPKVRIAAEQVVGRAFRSASGGPAVLSGMRMSVSLLTLWVAAVAAAEVGEASRGSVAARGPDAAATESNNAGSAPFWHPQAPVQEHWATLRALVALAAFARILVAVYEDSDAHRLEDGPALRAFTDAVMDYADEVAVNADAASWDNAYRVPGTALDRGLAGRLAETWKTYCDAPYPAPRRLQTFVELISQ